MENKFNNRDFEQFVKQNADQYRMFPSEKVWKGIHSSLHTGRRWYGIGLSLLLLTIGTVTWVMLTPAGKNQHVSGKPIIIPQNNTSSEQKDQKPGVASTHFINNTIPFIAGFDNRQNDLPLIDNPGINEENTLSFSKNKTEALADNKSGIVTILASPLTNNETVYYIPININFAGIITDDSPEFNLNRDKEVAAVENKLPENKEIFPLSIESVVNSFEHVTSRKKLLWQVYFAPTISYRKLTENKTFLSSSQSNNGPFSYPSIYDINSVVTHKPDMGFELGFSTGYPLSKSIRVIAGLQFNVSKYDIRAYDHPTELTTIALNSGIGSSSSVSTATNYRNFDGYRTNWLHNLYLSASVPIGAELKLTGDNKTYLGIGGTIQPTYILGDRAYLISTDYKNYAEVPSLIRKWNFSTSFETFAGYSTGKINWKVGPQVRYQLLSSFQQKYPVKEHIFDFGLKVGLTLNQ
jgi:hypothetical protein